MANPLPLSVSCPHCGAGIDRFCRAPRSGIQQTTFHAARLKKLRERNMKSYEDALKTWFMAKAKMYGQYGEDHASAEVMKHLRECGLSEDTQMPEVGTVEQFDGTFAPSDKVPAVVMDDWACKCGKYSCGDFVKIPHPLNGYGPGYVHLEKLAVIGEVTLSNVIKEVIEAGRDDA